MGALADLLNLGPVTERHLREAGIETPEELRRVGSAFAFKLLEHHQGRRPNLLFLYAMEGALQGRDLHDFSPQEKAALQASVADDLETG